MAHILLAEDDQSMRHFLTAALEKAGHKVSPATVGLDVLNRAENQDIHFDLLLADIVMPGIDGIELSQRVSTLRPDIKVMFITGFAGVVMGKDFGGQSQARTLSKPFHLNDLVDQVDTILNV